MFQWNNAKNLKEFYENIPIQMLRDYAIQGGIEDSSDIDLVWDYLKHSKSILDIGAGYGRALKCLLNRGYQGKITALEASSIFYKELTRYHSDKVSIIKGNLLNFNSSNKFDVILWLWSGISDFTKQEQHRALKKLSCLLNQGGKLIIDTFPFYAMPMNASSAENQTYAINVMDHTVNGYIPSFDELKEHIITLPFGDIVCMEYYTNTRRKRLIYIDPRLKSSVDGLTGRVYGMDSSDLWEVEEILIHPFKKGAFLGISFCLQYIQD